jgi:hypothetical protein
MRFILPVFHIFTVIDIQVFGGNIIVGHNYWTFDRKKSPLVGQREKQHTCWASQKKCRLMSNRKFTTGVNQQAMMDGEKHTQRCSQ